MQKVASFSTKLTESSHSELNCQDFAQSGRDCQKYLIKWNVTPLIWAFVGELEIVEIYSSLFSLPPLCKVA